jgi:hypothetical protein
MEQGRKSAHSRDDAKFSQNFRRAPWRVTTARRVSPGDGCRPFIGDPGLPLPGRPHILHPSLDILYDQTSILTLHPQLHCLGNLAMQILVFSAAVLLLAGIAAADDEIEAPPLDEQAAQAVKDAGGNVMAIAQDDPRLDVTLHLSDQEITDEHLAIVARLQPVVWLNLAGTKVTDAGLAEIAGMTTLEKLHLEKTGIGDAGLEHLEGLQNLVYLNIYGTKVSDAGLEHLQGLEKLRKLYVWQTEVTDEGIARLKESLPEVEVIAGLELKPAEPPAEEEPAEGEDAPKEEEEKDADNNN